MTRLKTCHFKKFLFLILVSWVVALFCCYSLRLLEDKLTILYSAYSLYCVQLFQSLLCFVFSSHRKYCLFLSFSCPLKPSWSRLMTHPELDSRFAYGFLSTVTNMLVSLCECLMSSLSCCFISCLVCSGSKRSDCWGGPFFFHSFFYVASNSFHNVDAISTIHISKHWAHLCHGCNDIWYFSNLFFFNHLDFLPLFSY